ncbi:hypothetical protein [Actinophytocola gossypii]|uniref:Integral membrane protein n=1 Tax=Actinophytocola gossypii TaxID=2812003 RepID=A0ABT2J179_9PSEU|nr:hypothetical protein [Actinophytocola gossypii]MCT2581617.1 hypothetical protein [Actinophytocola gossypii]
MRAVRGAGAMVVLALFGVVLWGGPVTTLWARTFAQPCPAASPAPDCLRTAEVRVDRFDDRAEGDVVLSLTLSGTGDAVLTPEAADRIGVPWGGHDVPATVTLFDNEVTAITGPTGVTEEPRAGVAQAFLMVLVTSAAAVLVVAGAGLLWRRARGGEPGWIRRAAVCATVGTLVGVGAGSAFGALGVAWIMPATFAATVLVSLAAAFVRLPRAWTPRPVGGEALPSAGRTG